MTTNFLYAQSPNRKGNQSKTPPSHTGSSVTRVTGPSHGVDTPKGSQGPAKATGNIASRNQKVQVSTHADYCGTIKNDGYMNSDRNNFLK